MGSVTKNEGGIKFQASDYADVSDPQAPSTWKLRLAESKSGDFTVAQVARAITAMQPGGFRGNRVELLSPKAEVVGKINAAIGKISGADDVQKTNLRDRLSAVKTLGEINTQPALPYLEDLGMKKCAKKPRMTKEEIVLAGIQKGTEELVEKFSKKN